MRRRQAAGRVVDHRHRVRGAPRLPLDQLVQAAVGGGPGDRRVVAFDQLLALGGGQQRQLRQRRRAARGGAAGAGGRGAGDRGGEHLEVSAQAADGRGVEQVAVEHQRCGHRAVDQGRRQSEIELGGALRQGDARQLDAAQVETPAGRSQRHGRQPALAGRAFAVVHEHHLEERRAAGIALAAQPLGEPREGVALVCQRRDHRVAHPAQQLREGRVAGAVADRHHRVHKVADQAVQAAVAAARRGRAHAHGLLAAVAVEQRHQQGEQGHEGRRPRAFAQGAQARGRGGVDRQRQRAAAGRLHRRPRPVGGQRQGRRRGWQDGAPIRFVGAPARCVVLPAPLLGGERPVIGAGVERRQRVAAVERSQVAEQDAERAEIGGDVVHRERQPGRRTGAAVDGEAQERPAAEVERRLRPLGEVGAQAIVAPAAGVHLRELDTGLRMDLLDEGFAFLDESAAQRRMARRDRRQRPPQPRRVQAAAHHPRRAGQDVGRVAGDQAVEQQQRPLAGRGRIPCRRRRRCRRRYGVGGWGRRGWSRRGSGRRGSGREFGPLQAPVPCDRGSQLGQGRPFQQLGDRHRHSQVRLDGAGQLGGGERVQTQGDEGPVFRQPRAIDAKGASRQLRKMRRQHGAARPRNSTGRFHSWMPILSCGSMRTFRASAGS